MSLARPAGVSENSDERPPFGFLLQAGRCSRLPSPTSAPQMDTIPDLAIAELAIAIAASRALGMTSGLYVGRCRAAWVAPSCQRCGLGRSRQGDENDFGEQTNAVRAERYRALVVRARERGGIFQA